MPARVRCGLAAAGDLGASLDLPLPALMNPHRCEQGCQHRGQGDGRGDKQRYVLEHADSFVLFRCFGNGPIGPFR